MVRSNLPGNHYHMDESSSKNGNHSQLALPTRGITLHVSKAVTHHLIFAPFFPTEILRIFSDVYLMIRQVLKYFFQLHFQSFIFQLFIFWRPLDIFYIEWPNIIHCSSPFILLGFKTHQNLFLQTHNSILLDWDVYQIYEYIGSTLTIQNSYSREKLQL